MDKNKELKRKYQSTLLVILFFLSILVNVSLLAIYFFKILPHTNYLTKKVEKLTSQQEGVGCTKVFSKSQGKVVCLSKEELKSESLSECSENFREILSTNAEVLKGLKDISDLEKLREFSVKMCMQEKGYEYK